MCNSYKEELLACNLTVLSHCPACKANGIDVLAANHPSLPPASSNSSSSSSPSSSANCATNTQLEHALLAINDRLDGQAAKIEQLLELLIANNNRCDTNSVLSSSSSSTIPIARGASNYVSETTFETPTAVTPVPPRSSSSSSSSSRKRSNSNTNVSKETCTSVPEEKKSKKSPSNVTILETFSSQSWHDRDATNGSLDSILVQLSSILDLGERIKMLKELRSLAIADKKSVDILMEGGFKTMLIDWFKKCVDICFTSDEDVSSSSSGSSNGSLQIDGFHVKYMNNLLITIDEVAIWSTKELINNRLDKSIKACYKVCKNKGGEESQLTEYLKLMWVKYRGLVGT